MKGKFTKKWGVIFAIGVIIVMATLAVPVFSQNAIATQPQEETPPTPPQQAPYVNVTSTNLTHEDRGKVLAILLSSEVYKELKASLVKNHFTPKVDDATAIKTDVYDSNGTLTNEYISVYVPFKSHGNNERAGISAIVKDGKIVDISGGFAKLTSYSVYFNFNVISNGVLNNIETTALLSGNIIYITIKLNGEIVSQTQLLSSQSTLEFAHTYYYWWGWKVVLSEWETQFLINVLAYTSLGLSGISLILMTFSVGASTATAIASFVLGVGAVVISHIDAWGGHHGVYFVGYWWGEIWCWHN